MQKLLFIRGVVCKLGIVICLLQPHRLVTGPRGQQTMEGAGFICICALVCSPGILEQHVGEHPSGGGASTEDQPGAGGPSELICSTPSWSR